MKAAILKGVNNISIEEIDIPIPEKNEVLVEVKACGICQTDYSAYAGKRTNWEPPIILGHEISGIVKEIGNDIIGCSVGEEVILSPVAFCGKCRNCRLGYSHYCENGIVFGGDGQDIVKNGGFAEFITVPESTVYKKPEEVSFVAAALTEPLAGSYKGLIEYTNLKISEDIVIVGLGSMGLLVAMIAKSAGAGNIIGIDISDYRLEYSKKIGIDYTINAKEENIFEKIYRLLPDGPDVVFEAAGTMEAAELTFKLVRKGTRVNIFGACNPGKIEISPADIHFLETRVDSSFSVTPRHMIKSIDLVKKKLVDPEKIVTHRYKLEDIKEAFNLMTRENRVKIVIVSE